MVVKVETVEGVKEVGIELVPYEKIKIPKSRGRTTKVPGGPRGAHAPPLEDSGGYCSYEEKEWEVELDENYNPVGVTVAGVALDVSYQAWW